MAVDAMNCASVWEAIADEFGDLPALVWGEVRRTHRQYEERAARLASGLTELGVTRGDRIGVYLYNRPELMETYFAAFKQRVVPVSLNYRYVGHELRYLVDDARLRAVVYPTSLVDRVEHAMELGGDRPLLITVRDDDAPPAAGSVDLEQLIADHGPAERVERPGSDLFIGYTGGTTGMPKGVQWPQSVALSRPWGRFASLGVRPPRTPAQAVEAAHRIRRHDAVGALVVAPPLIHGTGFSAALGGLATIQPVALLPSRRFDPHDLCATLERERAVALTIVGDAFARPMVAALDEAVEAGRPYGLSSLRRIASSGTIWSAPVKRALHRHCRASLHDTLSASEGVAFGVMVTEPGQDPVTARFELGPNAKVLDDDGREVGPGQSGRLAVGGPIPLGYLGDEAATRATFRVVDGARYAVPGDFARLELDGALTLLGRGSVCINTGGEKVYAEEVEEAVKEVAPWVADCVVTGVPDPAWGELVCAVVSPAAEGRAPAGEPAPLLAALLRGRLAGYKIPKRVVVVPVVQRSPSGKADYRWAREVAGAGDIGAPSLADCADRSGAPASHDLPTAAGDGGSGGAGAAAGAAGGAG